MEPVEKKLGLAMKEEPGAGTATNLLQFLLNERDQAEGLLSNLTSLGEKALPETSTQGRERYVPHSQTSIAKLMFFTFNSTFPLQNQSRNAKRS